MEKAKVMIYLDPQVRRDLKIAAVDADTSLSHLAEQAIIEYLSKKKRPGK